ncbi:tol-pal system protein YbgF [Rhodobacteraceae bacterium NNCM2]|nr:tol-pal system protein YbgF [Coraliihabitans acroporae]
MKHQHALPALARFALPLAVAVAVAIGAPATAQTWSGSTTNPADLQYRLDLLDAELADIRARVGGSSAAKPSTGGGSIEVGRLEAEVSRLTSQVEQLQYENQQLKAQIARQLDDLIYRVTELEGGDPSQTTPVVLDQQSTAQSDRPVILSEQADLDRAKLDIQQGRFDQGEDRLNKFVNEYPSSSLVGEAYYWLGQSNFVRGEFPAAASTYLAGYKADKAGTFAADNLLQLGVTLGRLGQVDAGCKTLAEVERQFPTAGSTIQQSVRDEKASLGCQ